MTIDLPEKMPLRRHRDDDYWDKIAVHSLDFDLLLCVSLRYRFKTSDLSGDEWRASAPIYIYDGVNKVFERSFHTVNRALEYAPVHIYKALYSDPRFSRQARLHVQRKGHLLWAQAFDTFAEAALGMAWHVVVANEQSLNWRHLPDAIERSLCQQPGCAEAPANFFRYKKLRVGGGSLMVEPEYDWTGQYTWYCERHTGRGDCGLEDCDDNLELVAGSGRSQQDPSDESPAVFGGIVTMGKEDQR